MQANRTVPPATGTRDTISTKVKAINKVIPPPNTQANKAATPAILAAYNGAKSHAEPIVPFTLINKISHGAKRRFKVCIDVPCSHTRGIRRMQETSYKRKRDR